MTANTANFVIHTIIVDKSIADRTKLAAALYKETQALDARNVDKQTYIQALLLLPVEAKCFEYEDIIRSFIDQTDNLSGGASVIVTGEITIDLIRETATQFSGYNTPRLATALSLSDYTVGLGTASFLAGPDADAASIAKFTVLAAQHGELSAVH